MITDEEKGLLLTQYYDRGVLKKEIRSYEVSLWTLQDEFITVLKWSDVEQKGRIENPKMTLNIDGTQKFSFSIPMYYRLNGKLVENPNWYNVEQNVFMTSLRKIKVIFNKDEVDPDSVNWKKVCKEIYIPQNYRGNVNLENRIIVPKSTFVEAGWTNFTGDYGTILCSSVSCEIDGKQYDIIYTPIKNNGTVLSPSAIQSYLQTLISSGSSINDLLSYDAMHNKLIIGIYPVNEDHHNAFATELHEKQAEWDAIRAKYDWFGENSNPGNIEFEEPSYEYYKQYMRSKSVFEFVITDVKESHEKDILTCEIQAEGLAFQELGKLGYKVTLSQDNFELIYKEWAEKGTVNGAFTQEEPIQDLDYWCQEATLEKWDPTNYINPRAWYYDVQMNWDSFDGSSVVRESDKVYEESYTSAWNDNLEPLEITNARIKARAVSAEKSNLYNITQTIAETFEIFCRYEYGYDENFHIISRKAIFYNNFMKEEDGVTTLQYPYSSSAINRSMDGKDITTKLYVLDPDMESGYSSIMDAPPNASKEDYILNFDYLYQIGAITQEQYDAIKPYEIKMCAFNKALATKQNQLATYQTQLPEWEAKRTTAKNSIDLDEEQIDSNKGLQNALDIKDGEADGLIDLGAGNPDVKLILEDKDGSYYINLANTNKGIDADSVAIYMNFSSTDKGALLSNPVTKYHFDFDDARNITKIHLKDQTEFSQAVIDWSKVFKDHYLPEDYKGNVDLSHRVIVPQSAFIEKGYNDFDGTYGTVYSQTSWYPTDDVEDIADPTIKYDVIYTPILADGTVKTQEEIDEYISTVKAKNDTPDKMLSYDAKHWKVLLAVLPHNWIGSTGWESLLHFKQAEWDTIRAANKWFGYESNPSNVEITLADLTQDLEYWKLVDHAAVTTYKTAERLYLTYKYNPNLYYQKIIDTYSAKKDKDIGTYQDYNAKLGPKSINDADFDTSQFQQEGQPEVTVATLYSSLNGLYKRIDDLKDEIQVLKNNKEKEIRAFEHLMGPALREGYWQPEDYNDYGDHKQASSIITNNDITADLGTGVRVAWDTTAIDVTDTLYYRLGANEDKIYYPCIDLSAVFGANIPQNLEQYSLVWKSNSIKTDYDWTSIQNLSSMPVGSKALIKCIRHDNANKLVLMLIGTETMSDDEITRMKSNDGGARLEIYTPGGEVIHSNVVQTPLTNAWIELTDADSMIYPRIKFSSQLVKTDTTDLVIKYGETESSALLFNQFTDYTVNTYNTEREGQYYPEYYITIKLESMIRNGWNLNKKFFINYVLSNANTSIYLDAKKVSQENAYPKVAYEVTTNLLNTNLTHTLYQKLAQIVMINDTDLKFENVFGYISQVELDLDNISNDVIEVKNYKTKFEDLFSSIVAATEAMKRSGAGLTTALSGGIPLSDGAFASMFDISGAVSNKQRILDAYLDSHFDSSQVVKDTLTELFTDASYILSNSQAALNKLGALTGKNAGILSNFARNVASELTVKVFKQANRPEIFKKGDIWIRLDKDEKVNPNDPNEADPREIGRYMAITSSNELQIDSNSNNPTRGWVRTYDGTLASITGAAINVDAASGQIDIEAQNYINIRSGNGIYIAANENVDIVGNRQVNIAGTQINLSTAVPKLLNENGDLVEGIKDPVTGEINPLPPEVTTTGINLIAGYYRVDGDYDGSTSRVLISPDKIEMGASELELKAASRINLFASAGDLRNTSVIKIDANDGVYVGGGAGVTLFGGAPTNDVYVGPKHKARFMKNDVWIQIQKIGNWTGHEGYDGDWEGTDYYRTKIIERREHVDYQVVKIYKAIDNWDEYFSETDAQDKTSSNSTTGWNEIQYDSRSLEQRARAEIIGRGASVELNDEHLLMGFMDVQAYDAGTVIEMTKDYLIFGAGNAIDGGGDNSDLAITGRLSGVTTTIGNNSVRSLIGAMFTKESIGFATQDQQTINAVIMNDKGITIGSDDGGIDLANSDSDTLKAYFNVANKTHGSYVRVGAGGIELGSMADLYVNTDNFKLQTHSREKGDGNSDFEDGRTIMAVGNNLNYIDQNSAYNASTGNIEQKNNDDTYTKYATAPNVDLLLNKNGLYISGTVYAHAGSFTGNITAKSFSIESGYENQNSELYKLLHGDIQKQIDDDIESWSGFGTPRPLATSVENEITGNADFTNWNRFETDLYTNSSHEKHKAWREFTKGKDKDNHDIEATELNTIRQRHEGDVYTDIAPRYEDDSTKGSFTSGQCFRWVKEGNSYYWMRIPDTMSTKALELIDIGRQNVDDIFNLRVPLNGYFPETDVVTMTNLGKQGLLIGGVTLTGQSAEGAAFFRANHVSMGFFYMADPTLYTYKNAQGALVNTDTVSGERYTRFRQILDKDVDNGWTVKDEAVFAQNVKPLLYYDKGSMYISGTLFADEIIVRNSRTGLVEQGLEAYVKNKSGEEVPNLIDDHLSAQDYWAFLSGGYAGVQTNIQAQSYWNFLSGGYNGVQANIQAQSYWNFLNGGYNGVDTHIVAQDYWTTLSSRMNAIDGGVQSTISLDDLTTTASKIINGETGLAFANTTSNTVIELSERLGLLIIGGLNANTNKYPYFAVSNDAMGFFTTEAIPAIIDDWKPNTVYHQYDIVKQSNIYYRAKVAHTSGQSFESSKWGALPDGSLMYQYQNVNDDDLGHLSRRPTISDSLLYFDGTTGDLAIKGQVYAKSGWFGGETGFIIASNEIRSAQAATNNIPDILIQTSAASNANNPKPVFQLAANGNPLLKFENGSLEISGTIHASGGWLGDNTNGWVIGGVPGNNTSYTVVGTTITGAAIGAMITSTNNKFIMTAGTSTSSPILIMKDANDNNVFEFWGGNGDGTNNTSKGGLKLTGTIQATGGYLGDDTHGWVIGGDVGHDFSVFDSSDPTHPKTISQPMGATLISNNNHMIFAAGGDGTSPMIQLKDMNGTNVFEFYGGHAANSSKGLSAMPAGLKITGTINALGGYLGDATNGWVIGNDSTASYTVLGTSVSGQAHGATIISKNNKVILSAGTSNSAPIVIMKGRDNSNVFEFWGGDTTHPAGLKLTGTIQATGGWFGAADGSGWIIGGDVETNTTTVTTMDNQTFTVSGSRIQSANNKVIINAGNNDSQHPLEPYIIMRKDNNGTLEDVFEYYNGEIALKGAITATSFLLQDSNAVSITKAYRINESATNHPSKNSNLWLSNMPDISANLGKYLWTKTTVTVGGQESSVTYAVEYIAQDGSIDSLTITTAYATSTSDTQTPDANSWVSDISNVSPAWGTTSGNNQYIYLWTRTTINGIASYSVSRHSSDGTNAPYITTIEPLYVLRPTSESSPPVIALNRTIYTDDPNNTTYTQIGNSNHSSKWCVFVPDWDKRSNTNSDAYVYWRSVKYTWSDDVPSGTRHVTFETPYQDYGLTVANKNATQASTKANAASTSVEPIGTYGMVKNYTWNNTTYGLAIGNTATTPMLIGSNSGLTIVDTNIASGQPGYGSSVVLTGGGIALHGSSINFTTTSNTGTNVVSLSKDGIELAGGSIELNIDTNNYIHMSSDGLEMQGKHLYINGQQEWSRDDIIVMKQTVPQNAPWQDTVAHIEAYMKNQTVTIANTSYKRGSVAHDWVLIKPYYNAELHFTNTLNNNGNNTVPTISLTSSAQEPYFGNGATRFWYTLKIHIYSSSSTNQSRNMGFSLQAIPSEGNSRIINLTRSNIDGDILGADGLSTASGNDNVVPITFNNGGKDLIINTIQFGDGQNAQTAEQYNLCQEGYSIQLVITLGNSTNPVLFTIDNVELIAHCNAASSKVPCTVYYYP